MKRLKIKRHTHPLEMASTMGCRTVNGADINFKEVYEANIYNLLNNNEIDVTFRSAAQKDGRGNIAPVTIIMPTIAMKSMKKCKKDTNGIYNNETAMKFFLNMLDKKINEAKDMLIERFEHICSQSSSSAKFMWDNKSMEGYIREDGIRSAIKHGTLVIGQLGLAETLQILIGCDHTCEEGMKYAKQIEELFNKRCAEFKNEYKLNFGVYYTPAENLCYTAMKKFQDEFGIIPNVSDREYFTNSMHVPVWKEMDPFTKIDIESQLTGYSNAGCITYVELPSTMNNNLDALESIVNYAMEKDIPYFACNIVQDICQNPNCGFTGEFNDCCPKCGCQDILQLRRVTGYLQTDYRQFNLGKQAEVKDRVKHMKS